MDSNSIWHTIITAIGASGIVGMIVTMVVTRKLNQGFDKIDRREELRDQNQLLMMERVDNSAKMTHLMATKLHDAGIINGDLKELDEENKKLNRKYDENIRDLALEVLRSKR